MYSALKAPPARSFSLRFSGMRRLLVVAALLTLTGCSKETSSEGTASRSAAATSAPTILDTKSLEFAPSGTLAFMVWDSESPAYARLRGTKYATLQSQSTDGALSKIQEALSADPELASSVKPFIEVLSETGFLQTDLTKPLIHREGALFFQLAPGIPFPHFAAVVQANKGQDFNQKRQAIQQTFEKQGLNPQVVSVAEGAEGFSVALKVPPDAPFASTYKDAFVASRSDRLVIASSLELAKSLASASPSPGSGIKELRQTPEFTRATAAVGDISVERVYSYGYFNLAQIVRTLTALIPPAEAAKLQMAPESLPLEAFAISSGVEGQSLNNRLALSLTPKTESQKKFIQQLESSTSTGSSTAGLPQDTVLALALDGSILTSLKQAALAELPAEASQSLPPELALLDQIQGIALGLRGSAGPMPIPDLVLATRTKDAQAASEMLKSVKTMAADMMGAQPGMPFAGWQEKEVSPGVKSSYFLTPLGVGAYLAQSGDTFLLASSEKMVADAVTSLTPKAATLSAAMPASLQEQLNGKKSLVLFFSDFVKLATMLNTVQDGMKMFTGGQNVFEESDLNSLRSLGTILTHGSLSESILRVQMSYGG
jgi:hypothetical protein